MRTAATGRRAAMAETLRLPPPPPRPRPTAAQRRWQRLLSLYHEGELSRRMLLACPLLAVGLAIWAFGGVYGWAFGLAYLLVFAAAGWWAGRCFQRRTGATSYPIYFPILAFGALLLFQLAARRTLVPAETLTALLHLGAAAAVFFLVSQTYRATLDAEWVSVGFAAFTAALSLLAILQTLSASNAIYWHFTYTYASPAGSFVNRNHFSGCMEMLLPIAAVAAYQRRRRRWPEFLPWAAPPALAVAAIIVAASRGGALALAAETVTGLLALLYLGRPRPSDPSAELHSAGGPTEWLPLPHRPGNASGGERRRNAAPNPPDARRATDPWPVAAARLSRGPARVATLLVAVALTITLVLAVGSSQLQSRLRITNAHAPSLEQRHQLNLSSLAMFRQRPLWGWGLGTWADAYPGFARFTGTAVFAYAHNDYLQLLAETGLAGAACALGFWCLWGWELAARLRRWRHAFPDGRGAPPEVALALGAAVACLGLLVHSWVDFNLHIPANLMLFFVMAALAISPTR